jgi:CubicO group peptidase (beta-lactamase class C family)
MKRTFLIPAFLSVLIFSGSSIICAGDELAAKVDKLFAEWDTTHSPGCSIAVIKEGKIIYERGYGMANLEHCITNKPGTVFRIASTSKQFTAACIAMLYLRGQLDLNASIRTYIPELSETYQPVTVRQMVHHISGIRDYLELQELRGMGDDDFYTPQDVLDVLYRQKALNFKEGSEYLYSNSGYFLLGEIVKRVSGKTLAEFAKENIFDPLGMTSTHFQDDCKVIVPNRATGYSPTEDGFRIDETILPIVGDGAVFTTVEDMARWDLNFYDNKLDKGLIELTLTRGKLNDGKEIDYAFGLTHGEYRGLKVVEHGGSFVGFRSEIMRFPEQRFTVVILCNLSSMDPAGLCNRVANIYLADQLTMQEQTAAGEESVQHERITLPAEKLAAFAGSFKNEANDSFWDIAATDQGLKATFNQIDVAIFPVSETVFTGELFGLQLRLEFTGNDEFTFFVGSRNINHYKKFTPPQYTAEQVEEYIGDYYSDELDMLYKFVRKDSKLYLKFRNAPDDPFKPISPDIFRLIAFNVTFLRDEAGKVNGMEISAGRVKGISFVKR